MKVKLYDPDIDLQIERDKVLESIQQATSNLEQLIKEADQHNNPYLEFVKKQFGTDFEASYEYSFLPRDVGRFSVLFSMREQATLYYAWAIPDEAVLEKISKYGPIIEIGAGSGYWASQLSRFGADIIAFDKFSEKPRRYWFDVAEGTEAEVKNHPTRNLFLCWPPYQEKMAAKALKIFKGEYVIYVGEFGGCTADVSFHNLLERKFSKIESIPLPKWPGIHDYCYIYRRNKK